MAQYGLLIYIYVLMSCLRTLCTQFVRSRQWNKLVAVDGEMCIRDSYGFDYYIQPTSPKSTYTKKGRFDDELICA